MRNREKKKKRHTLSGKRVGQKTKQRKERGRDRDRERERDGERERKREERERKGGIVRKRDGGTRLSHESLDLYRVVPGGLAMGAPGMLTLPGLPPMMLIGTPAGVTDAPPPAPPCEPAGAA